MAGRHERRTSPDTTADDLDPQVQELGDCSQLYVKLEVRKFATTAELDVAINCCCRKSYFDAEN